MEDQVRIHAQIPDGEYHLIAIDCHGNVLVNATTPIAFLAWDREDKVGTAFYTPIGRDYEGRKTILLGAFARILKCYSKLEETDPMDVLQALYRFSKGHGIPGLDQDDA